MSTSYHASSIVIPSYPNVPQHILLMVIDNHEKFEWVSTFSRSNKPSYFGVMENINDPNNKFCVYFDENVFEFSHSGKKVIGTIGSMYIDLIKKIDPHVIDYSENFLSTFINYMEKTSKEK